MGKNGVIKDMPVFESKDIDRFLGKIRFPKDNSVCWEWQGEGNNRGYGSILVNRQRYLAHRISYFLYKKVDPKKLLVLHSCDNRKCINPNHLFLGTALDNTQDMMNKGRMVLNNVFINLHKNFPEKIARGEKSGRVKLTEGQVLTIRKEYSEGNVTERFLAKEYNVHPATIQFIIQRRNWKHI